MRCEESIPAGHYLLHFETAVIVGRATVDLGVIARVGLHQSHTRRLQRRTIGRADHPSTDGAVAFRFWFLWLVRTLGLGLAE